ncbi:MAG: hypothetical protein JJT77_07015 [Crocinitomicaceae bacterium]|nr:hypothetical protein [Crocinitomicaceae bacterium]
MGRSRDIYKRKIRFINFFAELMGSAIFSFLYFLFIARFLSADFELTLIILGLLIGLAYIASVYIPFYTYRIHIIPFISIIRALQKKKWSIIFYKLPAQFIGAFVGTYFFLKFSHWVGIMESPSALWEFKITNPSDLILFNSLTVFVLCYLFYVIQLLFKNMGFRSTFYYALVIQVVFIFTCKVSEITAINIFGYLSLSLLEKNNLFSFNIFQNLLIHFIVPSMVAVLIYFYIRDRFVYKNKQSLKSGNLKTNE